MKHLFSVGSLLLSISLLLAACGSSEGQKLDETAAITTSDMQTVTEQAAEELQIAVPKCDYGGETFTFLTRPNDSNGYWGHIEFYAAETNAVPVNDAVFARNQKIEEWFNIVFAEVCEES